MPKRGRRRVKKRTDQSSLLAKGPAKGTEKKSVTVKSLSTGEKITVSKKVPRSFVVKHGKVSRFAKLLVQDLRKVMNPYTANELKERKGASIKDYIAIAGAFEVTHIIAVTQGEKAPNLKIGRVPLGPTVTFRIEEYALSKTIRTASKRSYDSVQMYEHPPLVVLNNFDEALLNEKRHLKIASLTFQSMFPAINVKTVKLSSCKRVLLVHLNQEDESIEVRHYLIRTVQKGSSRAVKMIIRSKLPKLGDAEDISDILNARAGYATSDSEFEEDNEIPKALEPFKLKTRKMTEKLESAKAEVKSVVRLHEIGPRLKLRVLKVQDGLFDGEVQYHAYQSRTKEEVLALRKTHEKKQNLKLKRKKEQEENVRRKRELEEEKREKKRAKKLRRLESQENGEAVPDNEDDEDNQSSDDDGDIEDDAVVEELDEEDVPVQELEQDGNEDDGDGDAEVSDEEADDE